MNAFKHGRKCAHENGSNIQTVLCVTQSQGAGEAACCIIEVLAMAVTITNDDNAQFKEENERRNNSLSKAAFS